MDPELVRKYAAPVPRYTSYPTAPHFSAAIGHAQYAAWLADLPAASRLSLYVHVPFCQKLCWYCGCTTKATRRYEPVAGYLRTLLAEISNVSALLGPKHTVDHIHWGGGSPNILAAADIARLGEALRAYFRVSADAEIAVEIDARFLTDEQAAAFKQAGVNRVSFGVQDFDEAVQHAINRRQGYDLTARAVEMIRKQAITAINVDLVYGLPQQTLESLQRTIAQVLTLQPDRIAVFGYAHLPTRLKHQRLIDGDALPDGLQRFQQAAFIADELERTGYVRIGLDHFARPGDPLAQAKARRNFQGYTTDHTDALIGLGASAIGRLPQGYVQNATTTGDYTRGIRERGLATARGLRLSEQDRVRGHVIERLMCDLEFDGRQLEQEFGAHAKSVVGEARALIDGSEHGLIEPTDTGFRVTSRGRPFLRAICAHFDAYLGTGTARHSIGV